MTKIEENKYVTKYKDNGQMESSQANGEEADGILLEDFGVIVLDGTDATGALVYEANCGTEGIDVYVPGSGIRCRTGIYLDLTNTTSVTIGYTG